MGLVDPPRLSEIDQYPLSASRHERPTTGQQQLTGRSRRAKYFRYFNFSAFQRLQGLFYFPFRMMHFGNSAVQPTAAELRLKMDHFSAPEGLCGENNFRASHPI
jgi:hypothetical protein